MSSGLPVMGQAAFLDGQFFDLSPFLDEGRGAGRSRRGADRDGHDCRDGRSLCIQVRPGVCRLLGLVPRHRGTGRRAVNLHQHGKSQYRNRTRLQSLLNRAYARRWWVGRGEARRGARSSMNVVAASLSRWPTYQDATSFVSASSPTHVQMSPAPSGAAFAVCSGTDRCTAIELIIPASASLRPPARRS